MNYITIPASYVNWTITPLEKITVKPIETTVTFKYEDKYSWLDDLFEETKENWKIFNTHKDFMRDLLS